MVDLYTALVVQRGSYSAKKEATVADVKENMKKNIEHVDKMVGWGVKLYDEIIPVKLAALPEGTLGQNPSGNTDPAKRYQLSIPGEETDLLAEIAKKYEIFLVANGGEYDEQYGDINNIHHLNCNFIFNPDGKIILKYRKINPWIPLENATSPHDLLDRYNEE